jgi:hypothetical protein
MISAAQTTSGSEQKGTVWSSKYAGNDDRAI